MKNILYAITLCILFSFQRSTPEIKIYEKEEKIEKLQRKGFAVLLLLEEQIVRKAWAKKVKEFGKSSASNNEYIVNEAVVPSISAQPVRLYSQVSEKNKQGTELWISIDMGTEFVTGKHEKSDELQQLLYQFAVDSYKADYQLQVDEAEKMLSKTTKEYEKTVAYQQRIQNRMERNKENKKDLLERLKENRKDSVQLVKDKEMNKLEQKQDSLEVIKMKKAVEIVKSKMDNVK